MLRGAIALAIATMVVGCASVPQRNPLPAELADSATVYGGPETRWWGDAAPDFSDEWFAMTEEELRERAPDVFGRQHHYLAISGGGANGAFGAGLLCGWTEAGTRPEFTLVTGISTGALIAPFAFLGPDYDHILRRFYTTTSTEDILKKRGKLKVLTGDAAASSEPLQSLIAELVDADLVAAIAREHLRGRQLTIGTTNLDAGRAVHWDIGDIAVAGGAEAVELIRKVLLASASIPAAFPPVLIEVEADGETYDELHVDGGAAEQVFIYPAGIDWERVLHKLNAPGHPDLYVIRNSKINPKYEPVDNRIFAITGRSVSSMIRTQGIGNLYEIYLEARRDGLDYNLAHIPEDFDNEASEEFDPVYMKALFDRAYGMAKNGYPWKQGPPGYDLKAELD